MVLARENRNSSNYTFILDLFHAQPAFLPLYLSGSHARKVGSHTANAPVCCNSSFCLEGAQKIVPQVQCIYFPSRNPSFPSRPYGLDCLPGTFARLLSTNIAPNDTSYNQSYVTWYLPPNITDYDRAIVFFAQENIKHVIHYRTIYIPLNHLTKDFFFFNKLQYVLPCASTPSPFAKAWRGVLAAVTSHLLVFGPTVRE